MRKSRPPPASTNRMSSSVCEFPLPNSFVQITIVLSSSVPPPASGVAAGKVGREAVDQQVDLHFAGFRHVIVFVLHARLKLRHGVAQLGVSVVVLFHRLPFGGPQLLLHFAHKYSLSEKLSPSSSGQ
jgi:hypothetical protein